MRSRAFSYAAMTALGVLSLGALSLTGSSDPVSDAAAASAPPPSYIEMTAVSAPEFPRYMAPSYEVAEGARLFGYQRCAECHSDVGVVLGPGNGNIDTIATAIRDGRPGGMPAYSGKLTDTQIWQIAAFVQGLDSRPDGATVKSGIDLTAAR